MRVLLVAMPFSALGYPSIGLSLLKPALGDLGVACDIRYFMFDFADRIGDEAQAVLTSPHDYRALLGEWLFAGAVHGDADPETSIRYFADAAGAGQLRGLGARHVAHVIGARQAVVPFIEWCAEEVGSEYDVVGFTSSFQQSMASLALAQRIKERSPQTRIVFGGANCRAEMGIALLNCFDCIDAVCLDEGDRAFPRYITALMQSRQPTEIPGMAVRADGAVHLPSRLNDAIPSLDPLPDPDFSDFFEQHRRSAVGSGYSPAALFETARGCWWGAKHHCTFCGINGQSMAFRSKSPERAHSELKRLAAQYGSDFVSVDAILDMGYFETLLPRIAESGPDVTMYCEVKSNLKPKQLVALAQAGLRKIQPGIEALDSEVLALMRKGCTAIQNIQTLKLAAECGLFVEWNLLFGFPGETRQHYENTAAAMGLLHHLQPPNGVGPVSGDRFSPMFERPDEFGLIVEPMPAYRYMYPFEDGMVRRLAYHFNLRHRSGEDPAETALPASEAAAEWQARHERSSLSVHDRGDVLVVEDGRGAETVQLVLSGVEAAVYRLCPEAASRSAIGRALPNVRASEVDAALADLMGLKLLFRERELYLALALRQPGFRRAPSWTEVRAQTCVPYLLQPDATGPAAPSLPRSSMLQRPGPSTGIRGREPREPHPPPR